MWPETIILKTFYTISVFSALLHGLPTRSMLGPRCLQGKVCISNPDCAGAGCPAGRGANPEFLSAWRFFILSVSCIERMEDD